MGALKSTASEDSGNIFQSWKLEFNYFHMLQQMVDLAAVLSIIKPDKLLHDPVEYIQNLEATGNICV